MGPWERRNEEIATLREMLKGSPTNLDLADRYWIVLAGDEARGQADLRTGSDVIEAYRAVALLSKEGVEAFGDAYRVPFELSGETPRPAYFDQELDRVLKAALPELSIGGRNNVEWLLRSIGALGSSQ